MNTQKDSMDNIREGGVERKFPLGSSVLLVWVFFMTFIGRTVLSPLLLAIEEDLRISHAQAGSFFLVISVGLMLTMLFSGFLARRLNHHTMITLSAWISGIGLLILASSQGLWVFRIGLFILGMGAGLYLPSGVTTLTDIVPKEQWGRAIAMHELGPILGLASAPVFAQAALTYASWRPLLYILAAVSFAAGVVFARWAGGGKFPGTSPRLREMYTLVMNRRFWRITFFFIMAIGLEMGIYSMLPTYLVVDRGLEQSLVNSMVGSSRLTSLLAVFIAGWLSDRLGYRLVIAVVALSSGFVTTVMGLSTGWPLVVAVYLQPMLISAFFPAGFTAMAEVGTPVQRNLSVSLVIPIAYLFGGGALPTLIGWLAERDAFHVGFIAVGALMAAGVFIVPQQR